jgi:hypothetical protein
VAAGASLVRSMRVSSFLRCFLEETLRIRARTPGFTRVSSMILGRNIARTYTGLCACFFHDSSATGVQRRERSWAHARARPATPVDPRLGAQVAVSSAGGTGCASVRVCVRAASHFSTLASEYLMQRAEIRTKGGPSPRRRASCHIRREVPVRAASSASEIKTSSFPVVRRAMPVR